MTAPVPPAISPPHRLLCGPGPTNVDPAALAAMDQPLLGYLDPHLSDILLEVVRMLRAVYRAPDDSLVLPLQATGTTGMETGLASLTEPGDTVVVGSCGYFGRRMVQIARRYGAEVVEVEAEWGRHVPNERLLDALDAHPDAALLAIVHGETSTGARHPLAELAAAMRDRSTLLMADCVTTLGGIDVNVGAWGVDYAYSCTQKCIGAPPGMSPVAVSPRALERFGARRTPAAFGFDFDLLREYWIQRPPVYHHTAPVLHIYALHETLRQTLIEGLPERLARHERAGRHLQRRLRQAGLEVLAEPDHQLPQLTAVCVPEGVDGKAVQDDLLRKHDIEVGGGLPGARPMWRIGLMGPNASEEIADRVLDALMGVLGEHRVSVGA